MILFISTSGIRLSVSYAETSKNILNCNIFVFLLVTHLGKWFQLSSIKTKLLFWFFNGLRTLNDLIPHLFIVLVTSKESARSPIAKKIWETRECEKF